MKIYTSEEILGSEDLYEIQEQASNLSPIRYQMTNGEMGWLEFVTGRYSIADWVIDHLEIDDEGNNILEFDSTFSEAFHADGHEYKAVCLSDETALQKLFFWCYEEQEELSECCGAEIYTDTDICSECKEHC